MPIYLEAKDVLPGDILLGPNDSYWIKYMQVTDASVTMNFRNTQARRNNPGGVTTCAPDALVLVSLAGEPC